MAGDKGRSVGPRSTRSKNRLNVSGKPRLLTLLIQGNKACIVELSSLQPHPRLPLPPFPSIPWNHRPAWSSIPGVTRGVPGPHLSVRVLWNSAPYLPGIPACVQEIGSGHSSGRVPGLPGRKYGSGFKPQNNSVQCRHREQA